jgi:hypothetical protein
MKGIIFLCFYSLITSIAVAVVLQGMPAPERTASPEIHLLKTIK